MWRIKFFVFATLALFTGSAYADGILMPAASEGGYARPTFFDARNYGVICNGTTDDTAALNTAIAAAVNGTLVIPQGACKITSALAIPSSIRIVGNGTGGGFSTSLRPNNSAALTFAGAHHSSIENLMIWPTGTLPPADLITITDGSYSIVFRDVRVEYDTVNVPTNSVLRLVKGTATNNDLVFYNFVARTDGVANYPIIAHAGNDFGSATFFDADLERADRCVKWEGGHLTFIGIYAEVCGVHTIHMEPSLDSTASLYVSGGFVNAPGSSVALGIKAGTKNTRVEGTYITPPSTGYQAYVYDLTGASNISLDIANSDPTYIGGAVALNPAIVTIFGSGMNMFYLHPATFANLGTPTPQNGFMRYCSDCTIANPCASGGTGAFAKRLNAVWVCN